ncbi:hypothetical protein RAVI111496_09200 [Rahnella victoriana]
MKTTHTDTHKNAWTGKDISSETRRLIHQPSAYEFRDLYQTAIHTSNKQTKGDHRG